MGIFNKKTSDIPNRRQSRSDPVRQSAVDDQRQNLFQRNRTLTGSTSNKVNTTHNQADLQSPRANAHYLALMRRKIGTILLLVFGVAIFVFWLLTQLTANVVVSISDPTISRSIDTTMYRKAINDYLDINPVSRLRFAMNLSNLSAYLTQALPEVTGVTEMSFSTIGQTDFTIDIRKPVAGWTINTKQYFVDAKGVAFERNYYDNPAVQIVDDSGATLQQGTTVASNSFLGFVGRVVSASKDRGYTVTQAILPAGTTRQLEIKLQGVVPLIKLSIDRPAGVQIEDTARSLGYFLARKQAPSYIDVRVRGKAFYQ